MNTNQIKKFATEARSRLIKGVGNQMKAYFNDRGTPHFEPIQVQGGCVYGETLRDERFYHAWQSLRKHIMLYGVKTTIEEVAYTWFNRLVAINILAKNNLAEPVLKFANPMVRVPLIVEQARSGQLPAMSVEAHNTLNELLNDDSKTIEQFSFLIDCYCIANPIIKACFGSVDDYSYLLLPNNILAKGELVDMLNHSEYICDEDYQSPELIGWLYQFYISEKKAEVMAKAKNSKYKSDEIPAATQIFTPNWIVKYMVQNSLGRIYLDNEPYSEIASKMKYLVPSEPTAEKFTFTDVKELTCADLACGSGHILNECFDLLYDIYIEQGYSRKDAIEGIFAHNLIGVDIDTRAKQMATFALLLKACRRDASFADAHAMPRVLDMPDPYPLKDNLRDTLPHFFLGGTKQMIDETIDAIELFDDAKDLGSIMKFNISPATREAIAMRLVEYRASGFNNFGTLFRYFDIILALTAKYASVVMNPPYMGSGNMNPVLSRYVKDNYKDGKSDLCVTFMMVQSERTFQGGYYANIIPPSWMFLRAYKNFRKGIIETQYIKSLLHLSNGVFGGDFGSSCSIIANTKPLNQRGTYFRLLDKTFKYIEQQHLNKLFLKANADYNFKFDFENYLASEDNLLYSSKGQQLVYPCVSQDSFKDIPGYRIGYWTSAKIIQAFKDSEISSICETRCGLATGDNAYYIRNWFEPSYAKISFGNDRNAAKLSKMRWFPYNCAGGYRKWYGLQMDVIDWYNDGYEMQTKLDPTGRRIWAHNFNLDKIFLPHLGWSDISSTKGNSFRWYDKGYLFTSNAAFHNNNEDGYLLIAYANSIVLQSLVNLLNPTLHFTPGNFLDMPFNHKLLSGIKDLVIEKAIKNISLSKLDWDAHETSWDFKENELVRVGNEQGITSLSEIVTQYKAEWAERFHQLHANEEVLNRQFIEIYELQDELTPEVPLDEITILQQGEISIENNSIVWHDDVIAKQLISYAIGCWFGRYRLDKPGLHIAHPAPTEDEIITYDYNGSQLQIDDDGISPILAADSSFDDNLCHRVRDFLRIVFGDEALIDNINWIEAALGKTMETYFIKEFWKDHKKMYQNRPIYWLFSSKKGAFQCLAYMHRMDAYTAERVRSKYLLPHIEWLANEIADMVANEAMLSTAQRRKLDNLRKQLDECREYHDRLHIVADQQIGFDLDDGVVVNHAKFGDVLAKIK